MFLRNLTRVAKAEDNSGGGDVAAAQPEGVGLKGDGRGQVAPTGHPTPLVLNRLLFITKKKKKSDSFSFVTLHIKTAFISHFC